MKEVQQFNQELNNNNNKNNKPTNNILSWLLLLSFLGFQLQREMEEFEQLDQELSNKQTIFAELFVHAFFVRMSSVVKRDG
jgi:hypothetical protein